MVTRLHLHAFMALCSLLVACSGGGSDTEQVPIAGVPAQSGSVAWPGRIWLYRESVLYATSYADEKKMVVAPILQTASVIVPVVNPSSNGKYILIYSADDHFTRTDFSIRNAADARELFNLTSENATYSAKVSNDGRYMAWQWASNYDSNSQSPAKLSVVELRSPAEGGVRWVGDMPSLGGTRADLNYYQWNDGNRLVYINGGGEVFEYSLDTLSARKLLSLPKKFGNYSLDLRTVRINSQVDKIAGLMGIDENHRELWVANIDGSGLAAVTELEMGLSAMHWSPDGRWLHVGDCRTADYTGSPTYSIPIGGFSWMIPSDLRGVAKADVGRYALKYLHEGVYSGFGTPCLFSWTQ